MHLQPTEAVTRANELATVLSSLKNLGLVHRGFLNEIMRRILVLNPGFLGVWTVWEPDALDGRDATFAGAPGHDASGRFVPLWHRYGGKVQLEANNDYDKPSADWYFAPARLRAEVLIDPYEYRVAGETLFITSQAAPILYGGRCVGVAGFDIHMDLMFESMPTLGALESIEAVLGRRHVLLGEDGQVRYCSQATRRLIQRYVGGKPGCGRRIPEFLDELIPTLRRAISHRNDKIKGAWTFRHGPRRLVVRFTRHPHTEGVLLLIDEQTDAGISYRMPVTLSPREQEVANWVAQGKSNEEIAIILGISSHTVKNHLDKIFRKLGVENRCAAAMAIQSYFHAANHN